MAQPSVDDLESHTLIQKALAGDAQCVRALVQRLSSVIAKRVAATLWQRARGRDAAQEVADISQDVFLSLFQSNGKALRAWDPSRGMSLERFVGMLAQHQVISILRSGRISPWRDDPTEIEDLDDPARSPVTPEQITISRQDLRSLLDRLRETLSPRGLELFQRIIVDDEPLGDLIETTGLTRDAIYQWKSRLLRSINALATSFDPQPLSELATSPRTIKGASQP